MREAVRGDSDLARADLLDATTCVDVAAVDVGTLPALDIDRPVQMLSERGDALDAAARRQDELTAADDVGSLGELLTELRS